MHWCDQTCESIHLEFFSCPRFVNRFFFFLFLSLSLALSIFMFHLSLSHQVTFTLTINFSVHLSHTHSLSLSISPFFLDLLIVHCVVQMSLYSVTFSILLTFLCHTLIRGSFKVLFVIFSLLLCCSVHCPACMCICIWHMYVLVCVSQEFFFKLSLSLSPSLSLCPFSQYFSLSTDLSPLKFSLSLSLLYLPPCLSVPPIVHCKPSL